MQILRQMEGIEETIFNIGNNFKLNCSIALSSKGKDDIKNDGIYIRTYNSSKYSNMDELSKLYVNISRYLVFSYKENRDGQFLSEEIYLSYPHIYPVKDFFNETLSDILRKSDRIYNSNGLTKEGNEIVYESMSFAQDKKIAIVPYKIDRDGVLLDGVLMFLNSDEYYVEIDLNTFTVLVQNINDFNLQTYSQNVLYGGLILSSILLKDEEENPSIKRYNNTKIPPRKPGKSIFNKRPTINQLIDDDTDDESDESDNVEEEISVPKKKSVGKKIVSKKELEEVMDDDIDSGEEEETPKSFKKNLKGKKKKGTISIKEAIKMSEDTDDEDLDLSDVDFTS